MSASSDRAVVLLVNYFEAIAKKAGMKWDPDYTAEITEAVEEIVTAAVAAIGPIVDARLADLDDRIAHLQEQIDTPNWRDRR